MSSVEIISKRNWNSKTFDTNKRKKNKNILSLKIQNGLHDIESDNSFVECNPSMRDYVGNVSTLEAIRGRYGHLRIGDIGSKSKDRVKILTKRDCGISLKLRGYKTYGPWNDTTKKIRFDTDDGITLNYYPSYKGVNIAIVIDNPQTAFNRYTFSIKEYGCSYTYEEINKGLRCISSTGVDDIFIKATYAIDANGNYGPISIEKGNVVNGYQEFDKVIHSIWLGNAIGPVEFDPSVTIQDEVDGGIIHDSFMTYNAPDTNFGEHTLTAFHEAVPTERVHGIIRVLLTNYGNVTWLNGKFTFTKMSGGGALPYNVEFYRLKRAWTENTVTWETADTPWQVFGGSGTNDKAAIPECTVAVDDNATTDFTVTSDTLNTYWRGDTNNQGALLYPIETGAWVHMASSENTGNETIFYGEYLEDSTNHIGNLLDTMLGLPSIIRINSHAI